MVDEDGAEILQGAETKIVVGTVCPKEGCGTEVVRAAFQDMLLVDCPLIQGDLYIQGQTDKEEVDCPLIRSMINVHPGA